MAPPLLGLISTSLTPLLCRVSVLPSLEAGETGDKESRRECSGDIIVLTSERVSVRQGISVVAWRQGENEWGGVRDREDMRELAWETGKKWGRWREGRKEMRKVAWRERGNEWGGVKAGGNEGGGVNAGRYEGGDVKVGWKWVGRRKGRGSYKGCVMTDGQYEWQIWP